MWEWKSTLVSDDSLSHVSTPLVITPLVITPLVITPLVAGIPPLPLFVDKKTPFAIISPSYDRAVCNLAEVH